MSGMPLLVAIFRLEAIVKLFIAACVVFFFFLNKIQRKRLFSLSRPYGRLCYVSIFFSLCVLVFLPPLTLHVKLGLLVKYACMSLSCTDSSDFVPPTDMIV